MIYIYTFSVIGFPNLGSKNLLKNVCKSYLYYCESKFLSIKNKIKFFTKKQAKTRLAR